MRKFSTTLLALLTGPGALYAQLDTNSNGMSDLWERHYNQGQLFGPEFAPTGDQDGDGQDNLAEAISGTDPLKFDPPEGRLVQTIRHVPATWGQEPGQNEPVLLSPEAFEIQWEAVGGKQYTLTLSPDLEEGSWLPVGDPIQADVGGPILIGCIPDAGGGQMPDKIFWRVQASDTDRDGDGLSDYEENLLGTYFWAGETFPGIPDLWLATHYTSGQGFDPDADDDGDGVTNFDEYLNGSNPHNTDSDGDGTSDADEINQGSNPGDNTDGGAAPSDPIEEVGFTVGGDFAFWHMEIQGQGPRDNRLLRVASQFPGDTVTRDIKLQRNNKYEITLHRVGGYPDWYCWEAGVGEQPSATTFDAGQDWYQLGPRNENARFFGVADHWLVDNRDGLLTGHLDSYYNDVASGLRATLLPAELVPDWNRDGMITVTDRGKAAISTPWRFWRNDDDDSGFEGGDDIPGAEEADYFDAAPDGVRDLVDFFPVHFDLAAVLQVLPETQFQYFLKHDSQVFTLGGAVAVPSFNVVLYPEAELGADPAGDVGVGSYLRNNSRAEAIAGRPSQTIPKIGLQLPQEMLSAAKVGKGVALFEARHATDNPIFIEVRRSDGTPIAQIKMPIRISEVENMFRARFLNENLGGGTQGDLPADPGNWPDADRNGKHFIFVHGYNVSGEQARGWNSEMFKRLFWSGSNAMFSGVAWHGNESQIGTATPDYWRNVHNAFQTSKSVADFVNALPGDGKCIAAHSLGNIVVSSAIKDHGLTVANYYMVDAAAAIEAYSPADTSGHAQMSHPDWRTYDTKLWCTEWHMIFPETDNRRKMTWRGRFGSFSNAYNFHSTGEEVLKNGDGTVPGTVDVATSGGVRAWVKQEMSKGFSIGTGGGLLHYGSGGWDFSSGWDVVDIYIPVGGSTYRRRNPAEAAAIPLADLEEDPFFTPFGNERFHDPALGHAEAENYDEVSKVLAESLPSLTFAAGSNPIEGFASNIPGTPGRNFNMMDLRNGWPNSRTAPEVPEILRGWLHSDVRNVAYLYTHAVFMKWVEIGGLNQ